MAFLPKEPMMSNNVKRSFKSFPKTTSLFSFSDGKDPLSQKAFEAAQLFASTNGWKYKAVSLDGIGLAECKEYELDKGISKLFGIQAAPSFFIANPTDKQVYPIGAGLIAVSDIEQNIEMQLGEQKSEL